MRRRSCGNPSGMWIEIEGERYDVANVSTGEYLPRIDIGNMDFYVAKNSEVAGEAARKYWSDMAENDPREFRAMVGDEALVQWSLGQWAGPGSTKVRSLNEWLDLHLNVPEEFFASYNGSEDRVDGCSKALVKKLGFKPTVAYRHN